MAHPVYIILPNRWSLPTHVSRPSGHGVLRPARIVGHLYHVRQKRIGATKVKAFWSAVDFGLGSRLMWSFYHFPIQYDIFKVEKARIIWQA